MEELWKDIEGYEGLYQVSNCGRVKSLNYNRTDKERILKPGKNENGYLIVQLFKNGRGKMHKVHRLVARAFIDNPDNLPIINHKDEDKTNNHVENLEWCSHHYNNIYGTGLKRRAEKMKGIYNTKLSKVVYQYTLDGEFIREWPSTAEVERQMGYSQGHISLCCNNKRKTANGFIWRYNKNPEQ